MKSKILIVEDESIEAMSFKQSLISFGYDVVGIASTGADAVKKAALLSPDLVLMDVILKGDMDGIEAASQIKKRLNIPVIYLTAHPEESTVNRAKLTTPYGYLIKPVSKTDLRNTIDLALYNYQTEKELERSEKKYRELVDYSLVAVYETNLDGEIIFANKAMVQMFEYESIEELKAQNIIQIYKNVADRENLLLNLKKQGSVTKYDLEGVTKSGKTITVVISAHLIGDKISGMIMDITKRTEIEKELRFTNEWLSFTQKASKSGFWDWNVKKDKITWSPEFYELFGLSQDIEPSFDLWLEVLHPDDREYAMEKINKAIQDHEFLINDYRVILPEGENIWIRALGTVYYDENNNPSRMSGICIDITPLKLEQEQHRKLELEYKSLFDNMLNGFAYCKMLYEDEKPTDFIYMDVNQAFESLTGLEDVVGKRVSEVIPGIQELDPELLEIYGRVAKTGEPEAFEMYVKSMKDWFSVSVYSQRKAHFVAVFNIITERKNAEKSLKESEKNLRFIMDNMTDVIGQIDPEGKILYFSPQVQGTGFKPEDIYGLNVSDVVHPDDWERVNQAIQQAVITREQVIVEYRTIKADGEYFWVEAKGKAVFNDSDEYESFIFSTRDIIARKKAQDALKESEEKYRSLFESDPDYTLMVSLDGVILDANKAVEMVRGLSKEEMVGKSFSDLGIFPEDELGLHQERFAQLLKEGYVSPYESRIYDKTGETRWVETRLAFIMKDNEPDYILIINSDINERKLAENRIKRSLKEKDVINQVIMELVKVKDTSEIYSIIGRSIKNILPLSYVLISSIDPEKENFRLHESFGLEDKIKKINSILGTDIYKLRFPVVKLNEEDREKFNSAQLISFDGIYDLAVGKIPRPVCKIIEKVFSLGKIYSIGFSREGVIYGSLTIILPKGQSLENRDVIETILHQGSITIQRQNAENRMKNSLKEKEVLLKEIHHRVKNNLQIISSLLDLQENYVKEDQTAVNVLKESQNRVLSMAMIHEMIYQSEDLSHINFSDYIRNLISNLFHSYGTKSSIITEINVEDIYLNIETSIPLGLLITELVSNSLKYAFPDDNKGNITVELSTKEKEYEMVIGDNGVGIPREIDFNTESTLGLRLVQSLVNQLDGAIQLDRTNGTRYTIRFKELTYNRRF